MQYQLARSKEPDNWECHYLWANSTFHTLTYRCEFEHVITDEDVALLAQRYLAAVRLSDKATEAITEAVKGTSRVKFLTPCASRTDATYTTSCTDDLRFRKRLQD